jgi:hypothetical protein
MPLKANKQETALFQLKVTLRGFKPPIWRRILITGNTKLNRLHDILQIAMGWTNSHLHMFTIRGIRYSESHPDNEIEMENEMRFNLDKFQFCEKDKFLYEYDFGDSWEHEILIEKILTPDPQARYPFCLDGKRACPPEDVGGVGGYENFLETIMDSSNPEHDEMLEWAGEDFQPEFFDKDKVNKRLNMLFR